MRLDLEYISYLVVKVGLWDSALVSWVSELWFEVSKLHYDLYHLRYCVHIWC